MQHISKIINQVANQPEPQNLPAVYSPISQLEPEDRKVIELKYVSKQIGTMNEVEVLTWAKALLLKIHVITGWVIPEDDNLLNILVDQFQKKMVESYGNVNPDEIEYAFRNNDAVKDWGKNMNLNLIDEVMRPYLNRRFVLGMKEEQAKPPKQLPAPEVSDEDFIEAVFNVYKINGIWWQIPLLAYKILEPELNLTKEDKKRIYQHIHETTSEGDIPELCKKWSVKEYFDKRLAI